MSECDSETTNCRDTKHVLGMEGAAEAVAEEVPLIYVNRKDSFVDIMCCVISNR